MCWWLKTKKFGPNIQDISGVDNIVGDMLSILPSKIIKQDEPIISKDLSREKNLFTAISKQAIDDGYPLDLDIVQKEQQK